MIFKTEEVFPGLWEEGLSKVVNLTYFSHFDAVEQAAIMCLLWGQIDEWKRQDLKYVEQLEKSVEAVLLRDFMLETKH